MYKYFLDENYTISWAVPFLTTFLEKKTNNYNWETQTTKNNWILNIRGIGIFSEKLGGRAQNLGATSDWAPASLFPCICP